MRSFCVSFALLAAFAIPAAAHADNFVITGGGSTLSFSLPSAPSSTSSTTSNFSNVAVTFNGTTGSDAISFLTTAGGGGFTDGYFGVSLGNQLFTGGVSDPTFTPGDYTFSNSDGLPAGSIAINQIVEPSKTGEPKSLFLLGTGALGLMGVRRRRPRL